LDKEKGMMKGYINSIVSKHLGIALEEHFTEDETFYEVLHDKLENLNLEGNLPRLTGFYSEYMNNSVKRKSYQIL